MQDEKTLMVSLSNPSIVVQKYWRIGTVEMILPNIPSIFCQQLHQVTLKKAVRVASTSCAMLIRTNNLTSTLTSRIPSSHSEFSPLEQNVLSFRFASKTVVILLVDSGVIVFFLNPYSAHSQVSGQLLVAELHQVLMEHEVTCHRTCFSLQLGGTTLDGLTKLCSIQGMQDGALIKVVEGNCLILTSDLTVVKLGPGSTL